MQGNRTDQPGKQRPKRATGARSAADVASYEAGIVALLGKLAKEPYTYRPWELAQLEEDQVELYKKEDEGRRSVSDPYKPIWWEQKRLAKLPDGTPRYNEDEIAALWSEKCKDVDFRLRHDPTKEDMLAQLEKVVAKIPKRSKSKTPGA